MQGFWLFMFVTSLLLPLAMLLFGQVFRRGIPEEVNSLFGYRTKRSRKNKDTWAFAHRYVGGLWLRLGVVLLLVTLAVMLFLRGEETDTVAWGGGALVVGQTLVLVLSIYPTEAALERTFDADGKRKVDPSGE